MTKISFVVNQWKLRGKKKTDGQDNMGLFSFLKDQRIMTHFLAGNFQAPNPAYSSEEEKGDVVGHGGIVSANVGKVTKYK